MSRRLVFGLFVSLPFLCQRPASAAPLFLDLGYNADFVREPGGTVFVNRNCGAEFTAAGHVPEILSRQE
jgi:hypothetical protein